MFVRGLVVMYSELKLNIRMTHVYILESGTLPVPRDGSPYMLVLSCGFYGSVSSRLKYVYSEFSH